MLLPVWVTPERTNRGEVSGGGLPVHRPLIFVGWSADFNEAVEWRRGTIEDLCHPEPTQMAGRGGGWVPPSYVKKLTRSSG